MSVVRRAVGTSTRIFAPRKRRVTSAPWEVIRIPQNILTSASWEVIRIPQNIYLLLRRGISGGLSFKQ